MENGRARLMTYLLLGTAHKIDNTLFYLYNIEYDVTWI